MQRQSRQIGLGMPRKRNRSTSLTYKFLGCVFSGIGKTLDPLPGGIYGSCVNTADFCALGARHERVLEAKLVVTIGLYDIHHIDTCDCRLHGRVFHAWASASKGHPSDSSWLGCGHWIATSFISKPDCLHIKQATWELSAIQICDPPDQGEEESASRHRGEMVLHRISTEPGTPTRLCWRNSGLYPYRNDHSNF
ncbi:Tether containing UBX domain for GLUT4 [Fusarium oxysporum f. sp. albedinis]|nr:Tether containing UBX domain for GLUT4 [Fusarium oxysporum f. sp. albedinis]